MGEWTYKRAGVSIERAEDFVGYIKEKVKTLPHQALLFGSFASGVKLKSYKNPVLMLTTDGVGTKLKVAQAVGVHNTVGIDLVAMNVNDLLTTGAKPIAFLDYIATGKIDLKVMRELMDGIVEGCRLAEVALVGGETAEMPDFYPEGVYDLAGFCLGVCEEEELITGEDIRPEDVIIGFPSSGFHSNGYSLIRKVLEDRGISYHDKFEGRKVWEVLLEPTKIYLQEVQRLRSSRIKIKGMAHITGGGIPGNLVRILPEGLRAVVEKDKIPKNPVFDWIRELGKIQEEEMFRTFNMGVGFMVVVGKEDVPYALNTVPSSFVCGFVEEGRRYVDIA
ncbi:phosphoribosylformylglycinamidine cyclo-ligase [Hydrogenobacter sp. T-2]|uniref:phosphoribosylformylglycinamidine cyclo-ligase n=1 Tax=Pampinifervens diazotrophicum TaxID=1632018 RepID=UPI002B2570E9|nr:phosphoribosylformylglycinamidine cyclo-ligase [Hydrogenobacter sp. T-2]WPM31933.1 phosphoribosylformylglycinamidine cyclo-ligase [Hydrogenobacter sp. T-2]